MRQVCYVYLYGLSLAGEKRQEAHSDPCLEWGGSILWVIAVEGPSKNPKILEIVKCYEILWIYSPSIFFALCPSLTHLHPYSYTWSSKGWDWHQENFRTGSFQQLHRAETGFPGLPVSGRVLWMISPGSGSMLTRFHWDGIGLLLIAVKSTLREKMWRVSCDTFLNMSEPVWTCWIVGPVA